MIMFLTSWRKWEQQEENFHILTFSSFHPPTWHLHPSCLCLDGPSVCVCVCVCVCMLVTQLCLTLCNLMDSSPPGSVHGILQARILEWVATSFSKGSCWPRDWTQPSYIAGRFFTAWTTREAHGPSLFLSKAEPSHPLLGSQEHSW